METLAPSERPRPPKLSATQLLRWQGLVRFLDGGRIKIDSDVGERAKRSIAGVQVPSVRPVWTKVASIVPSSHRSSAKMNDIDPQAYLADILAKIVNRHPSTASTTLPLFAYAAAGPEREVA